MTLFQNRQEAGQHLASQLSAYANRDDVIVLGLPRGGVPVAFEVAKALAVPLDVFLVRKLGVPGQEELAMGAIASGDTQVLNQEVIDVAGVTEAEIEAVVTREQQELQRREALYRGNRPAPVVQGKQVILIDDGLATGASMGAAVAALRTHDPARIIVAVPTASPEVCAAFQELVDEVICAVTPQPFYGVGAWYDDFSQTSDEEVQTLLRSQQPDYSKPQK